MTTQHQNTELPDDFSEHLRKFGYLDGNYTGICIDCENQFIGAKRSMRCKPCAETAKAKYDAEPRAAITPESEGIAGKGEVLEALQHAQEFIRNGVELGFIRMPDKDTPDPAHLCLPKIEQAIKTLAATKEEIDEVCMCGNYFSDHTGYEGHPFVSMGSPDDESTLARPQEIDVEQLKRECCVLLLANKESVVGETFHHKIIKQTIDHLASSGYLSAPDGREKELMACIRDLAEVIKSDTLGTHPILNREYYAIIAQSQATQNEG